MRALRKEFAEQERAWDKWNQAEKARRCVSCTALHSSLAAFNDSRSVAAPLPRPRNARKSEQRPRHDERHSLLLPRLPAPLPPQVLQRQPTATTVAIRMPLLLRARVPLPQ
jgi:hypothetical protein